MAFSCKKHGDSGIGISTPAAATTVDRIRQVHGSTVANELVEFSISDNKWGFQATGWASNANYHVKRTTILLFINHRSVESSAIKKAVEQTYSTFLPKGGHPFLYLSLDIEPQRVDVNVHPTKREVNFLNEDEIIEFICTEIRTKLAQVDTSRTFKTQTLLPGVNIPTVAANDISSDNSTQDRGSTPKTPATKKLYENNLVRTDSKLRKITSMLPTNTTPDKNDGLPAATDDMQYEITSREPVQIRLTSIKALRAEVRDAMHHGLTEIFASHTYVGTVDERRRLVAIQSGVKLFLVDYGMVSNEYFYQVGLTHFGNFGIIRLDPAPKLRDLLDIAAKYEQADVTSDGEDVPDVDFAQVPDIVERHLISKADMLKEYFSLEISEDGELRTIPMLMKGYMPCLGKLPGFLLRLGPYVDWTDEQKCFQTFLTELARFYVPEQLPPPPVSKADESSPKKPQTQQNGEAFQSEEQAEGEDAVADGQVEEDEEIANRRKHMTWVLEHVLFPAFRARLVATNGLLKGVVEMANLKGLYRVFERC